jgi:hypothetical protein
MAGIHISFPTINTTAYHVDALDLGESQMCQMTVEGFTVSQWFSNNDQVLSIEPIEGDTDTATIKAIGVGECEIRFMDTTTVKNRIVIKVVPGAATGLGLKAGQATLK